MAIGKKAKPIQETPQQEEGWAEKFIAAAVHSQEQEAQQAISNDNKTPIIVRLEPETLKRVTAEAKRQGLSRSAWIRYMVHRVLEQGEG